MITIIKPFIDLIEEKLGVRRNKRLTDLEQHKHGKPITHFDNGGEGLYFVDASLPMAKFNPTYTGVTEAIDRPVYDTTTIVSASTTSQLLFSAPQGTSSKTEMETNMTQSRSLPSPEQFTIKRFGLQIQTTVLTDLTPLLYQVLHSFYANQKLYTQAPLVYYPCGFGIWGGGTTANNTSVINNGIPGEQGVRSLVYDIPLNPLDPFYASLTVYGGGSAGQRAIGSLTLSATTVIVEYLQGPFQRAI